MNVFELCLGGKNIQDLVTGKSKQELKMLPKFLSLQQGGWMCHSLKWEQKNESRF